LFTWGNTQRECYLNSIRTIDQMGEFVAQRQEKKRTLFGGPVCAPASDRGEIAIKILPTLRGAVSSNRCVIAHYTDHEDALAFANSVWAEELSALGTSCPDHFLRTRVCPKREWLNSRKSSRNFTIMWLFRAQRRFALSTGRSKKPSCNACRQKPSSVARSCWLSAAQAESAGKSLYSSRKEARTSLSLITMAQVRKGLPKRLLRFHQPRTLLTRGQTSARRKAWLTPSTSRLHSL